MQPLGFEGKVTKVRWPPRPRDMYIQVSAAKIAAVITHEQ